MCQTLLFIPHKLFGFPIFGFGWLFCLWLVLSLGWLGWTFKKLGWSSELQEILGFVVVTGLVITILLPMIEAKAPNGEVLGLPIRGYGTLLLTGVVAGWALSARRAAQRGFSSDDLVTLAWPLVLAGVVGARLFFVIEYWPEFRRPTWFDTFKEILNFTKGGLVVYGSLFGGFLAFLWFVFKRRVSMFAWGDVIAPGVVLGMAIGRIGCLMNGCCYGGECQGNKWCIEFPRYTSVEQKVISPPYLHQLSRGRLHGFTLGSNQTGQPIVKSVDAKGHAAASGLVAGVRIAAINGIPIESAPVAEEVLANTGTDISIELADRQRLQWNIGRMPAQSRPVHPSQIYGAISGFLICFTLLVAEPIFDRPGALMALLLTLYPPIRFLEELIRDDEPPQWGTALTISQLISLLVMVAAVVTWVFVYRNQAQNRRRLPAVEHRSATLTPVE